jgi:hypothetical protein
MSADISISDLGLIELRDNGVREGAELTDRFNNSLLIERASLVDCYVRGDIEFGIINPILFEQTKYGFAIYADPRGNGRENILGHMSPCADDKKIGENRWRDESLVLAHDIETMEGTKRFIPSLIRLQRFDFDSFALGKPLYEFRSLVSMTRLKDRLGRSNGKIAVLGIRHVIAIGETASQNIEAASNGVDVSTCLDHETERKRRLLDCHYNLIRDIRIGVSRSDFDVLLEPNRQLLFEGWQLGYGPVDASLSM